MAHFAQLDNDNKVIQVIAVKNECCLNEYNNEDETVGAAFCSQLLGGDKWIQASYSGSKRRRFPGVGFYYDEKKDAFIRPKPEFPLDDFVLDEQTLEWVPPVACPGDEADYFWNIDKKQWEKLPFLTDM